MAQADQTVENATFPTVRAEINSNLAALFSASSGNTEPSVTVAFQDWINTNDPNNKVWYKRNAANNAWITIGTIIGNTITFEGTLPSQTGNAGEFLTTDGTTASWSAVPPGSSVEVFTSSGTWTKPSSGTRVRIELWGGGGSGGMRTSSGNNIGGGGGGACTVREFPLSLFTATCVVTIGSGAPAPTVNGLGTAGGTSSFVVNANYTVSAYGGGGGGANGGGSNALGGSGGGSGSAGLTANAGSAGGFSAFINNALEVGGGSTSISQFNGYYGGAGGGGLNSGNTLYVPGESYYGGGGGGGSRINGTTWNAGGKSVVGGSGGSGASSNSSGNAGTAPGGGGGGGNPGGAGARGECRVYVW